MTELNLLPASGSGAESSNPLSPQGIVPLRNCPPSRSDPRGPSRITCFVNQLYFNLKKKNRFLSLNLGFLQITKGPPITQEIPSILRALCQRPGTKSKYKFLNYTQSPLMLFPIKGCSFWSCRGEGGRLKMLSSKPVLPRGFYKSLLPDHSVSLRCVLSATHRESPWGSRSFCYQVQARSAHRTVG